MKWEQSHMTAELFSKITDVVDKLDFWVNEHESIRDAIRQKLKNALLKTLEFEG